MGRPLGHFCKEFSSKTEYVHAEICPGTICGWTVKKLTKKPRLYGKMKAIISKTVTVT
jgi:hypothetical protein